MEEYIRKQKNIDDVNRKFDEFLHLDSHFQDTSNNYDKQLFYYNVSIMLLMLFCIKELINYHFCWYIFIPPFFVIFLCGWSSIALMRTLNFKMEAFELQKKQIFENSNDNHSLLNALNSKNNNYNKCAFWSFVLSALMTFVYIVFIVMYVNFV